MASPAPLDVPEPFASESLVCLEAIMNAATRDALADAFLRGHAYLSDLHRRDVISAPDAVRVGGLWGMAAADRLRDLPQPGARMPVGLFAGRG